MNDDEECSRPVEIVEEQPGLFADQSERSLRETCVAPRCAVHGEFREREIVGSNV